MPARYQSGGAPVIQIQATGGGEVWAEVDVDPQGAASRVTILRETPPFTVPVQKLLESWRFRAAEALEPSTPNGPAPRRRPVRSRVFVAAMFRPPTINTPTFGQVPKPVRAASSDVPFPIASPMPQYTPNALFDGVVLVEVRVGTDGAVTDATVLQSAAGFDLDALQTAKQWRFHPARVDNENVPSYAYLAFAFRQPITIGNKRPGADR